MKLFLPEIGNRLILTKDWEFVLYWEHRNQKLLEKLGFFKEDNRYSFWRRSNEKRNFTVTIPAGTVMGVDRIYIRKGVSSFSSVTFTIPKAENKKHPYAGVRFWASLSDVNQIEYELISCNEETLSDLRKINDDLKKEIAEPQFHAHLMSIILDGKTLNMIRPQEKTITYIREASKRLAETKVSSHMKDSYEKVREYLGLEYRKLKVKEFVDTDEKTTDENEKAV